MEQKKALVIFSGGQDSSTCLVQALNNPKYSEVLTLSFDYGQKHRIELEQAARIAAYLGVNHEVIETTVFKQIGDSALLSGSGLNVNSSHRGNKDLPASFVPGRNIYFLTVAAMYAYKMGCDVIITGVSQEDYSGYPDCREDTIRELQWALQFGLESEMVIETPLINMSKAEEVKMMMKYEAGPAVLAMTHTCYNGEYPPCGQCPSCKLREKAFKEAGVEDPLMKQVARERR